jgi:hypothetical protein
MRFILIGLFILMFSTANFAQQKIGVPFELKKGETVVIGDLKIKYLGGENEWAIGWGAKGERLETHYLRYRFETVSNGKSENIEAVFNAKTGNYVLEVIREIDVKNPAADICKIVVKTARQFEKEQRQRQSRIKTGKAKL